MQHAAYRMLLTVCCLPYATTQVIFSVSYDECAAYFLPHIREEAPVFMLLRYVTYSTVCRLMTSIKPSKSGGFMIPPHSITDDEEGNEIKNATEIIFNNIVF